MIARISGTLVELNTDGNTIILEAGHLAYEILVPGYSISDLSRMRERSITLHCFEYYESSGAMGSNLVPCLVGFPQATDKQFFQRFISVKGIGARKALRALAKPIADIAYAIEQGDAKLLTTLPEIGKRTAEQIIAELKGKLTDFAQQPMSHVANVTKTLNDIESQALEILLQLGERRNEAQELIERASDVLDDVATTDVLVQTAYRLKSGSI